MATFPQNPNPGDVWISDSGAAYQWDGVKWAAHAAPETHPYLPLSGGQLTGELLLIPPVNPADAATKAYVDTAVASIGGGGGGAPTGPAGGDLSGTYPNPALAAVDGVAGSYVAASLTVDGKGRVTGAGSNTIPAGSNTAPAMDGVAAAGSGTTWARNDHIHPVDTSRYAASNPAGYQTATDVAAAPSVANNAGRNLLHNALFNVQQRGTGTWTATGAYTADRWKLFVSTSTLSVSIATANDTARSQIGDEAATSLLQAAVTGTAGASDYAIVQQIMEGVRRLAGKTVTVSFYAAASAGSPKLGVSLDQNFGTGGSPSAAVNGNGQTVTLSSTTYARYSLTFAIPSASGKTLGTNGDDSTALTLWYSAGSSFNTRSGSVGVQTATIYLWGVQLEIGTQATPLEKIDPGDDLKRCMRFYQTGMAILTSYQSGGGLIGYFYPFPVQMRAAPTLSFQSPTYVNCSSVASSLVGAGGANIYATVTATASAQFVANFTASADL